jgi:hypothetical protein
VILAREEHDREDLLAEAKALVERVSLTIPGYDEPLLIGFRRDGSASFYLAAERVYQFTSAGQLRRAYVDGLIYKAQQRQLVALRRQRNQQTVELIRHVLDPAATADFMDLARLHLETVHHALAKNKFDVLGQVPENVDVLARIRCWLDEFAADAEIALSPRTG